jgi:hypothetical protein
MTKAATTKAAPKAAAKPKQDTVNTATVISARVLVQFLHNGNTLTCNNLVSGSEELITQLEEDGLVSTRDADIAYCKAQKANEVTLA